MAAKKKLAARVKQAAQTVKKVAKAAKKAAARKPTLKRAKAQPIPKGYHMVTPHLVVRGAKEAITFYQAAFGAKDKGQMAMPDGRVMHAEIQIGDSRVMLADEMPEMGSKSPQTLGGAGASLMIYTKNVDALFDQAVKAGAKVVMPVADMFWGDRYGQVEDPFGHRWALATHMEDMSPKEMNKRAAAAMSGPPPAAPPTTTTTTA
jgi:uncharacterized glyoxalase superfamily protein PhnB